MSIGQSVCQTLLSVPTCQEYSSLVNCAIIGSVGVLGFLGNHAIQYIKETWSTQAPPPAPIKVRTWNSHKKESQTTCHYNDQDNDQNYIRELEENFSEIRSSLRQLGSYTKRATG